MLGRLNPDSKNVTVVGAGISGLLAAYYLDRAGYLVQVFEADDHAGGMISTRTGGFGISESAAHSIPATATVRELCSDLGVELSAIRPEAKARWIFRNGKHRRFPLTPFETIRTIFRAYFILAPAKDPETLTLEQWTRRFLGEAALRYLMTPFVRGIYGAEPGEILVSAAFPGLCVPRGHSLLSFLLAKKWRKHPPTGVKRAIPKMPRGEMAAPRDGMQALTSALEKRLQERLGERFRRGARINSLAELNVDGGNLILCVPAQEAARLLASDSPELSEKLETVRYSPLTTATVFLKRSSLKKEPVGLGVLIPPGQGRKCLGILYNSNSFPRRVNRDDLISLTVMFGHGEVGDSLIREELNAIFGLTEPPLEISRRRWEKAVPKYDAHLLSTWEVAEATWCSRPGHLLFGNYTGQVSIRGMAELAREISRIDSKS